MKTTIILSALFTVALTAPTTTFTLAQRQNNAQTFTGALGGIAATPVLDSGDAKRPFSVKGDTFVNVKAALQRSCDQQFNACADAANGGNANLSVAACSAQQTQCTAADAGVSNASAAAGAASSAASGAAAAASNNNNAASGKASGAKAASKASGAKASGAKAAACPAASA